MRVFFLEAAVRLTKRFSLDRDGRLVKHPYPHVQNFTSHAVDVDSIESFEAALRQHAAAGHCLIKGTLSRPLAAESRAGSTEPAGSTEWACWDLDRAAYPDVEAFLKDTALGNSDWIEQLSASTGISTPGTPHEAVGASLSAHCFQLFARAYPAAVLKQFALHLNLSNDALRNGITLSRTGASLKYPLDITTNQNDKLLYIADPVIDAGVTCDLGGRDRIRLARSSSRSLDLEARLGRMPLPEAIRKDELELRAQLRKAAGMSPLRASTKIFLGVEIQPNPGKAVITGLKSERGFVYLNLNGGDSWGYYHPEGNCELIHNFKGEPVYRTSELLPGYYQEQRKRASAENQTPSEQGDRLLAFRDMRAAAYWNGTWNPATQALDLHPARSERQLSDFMLSHGRDLGDFVPIWRIAFDPHSDITVDEERKVCNLYVMPRGVKDSIARVRAREIHERIVNAPGSLAGFDACLPLCSRIIRSAVGGDRTVAHFFNWLAAVYQLRIKLGTAWILHGVPGTGKGLTVGAIIAPTLGQRYVAMRRAKELTSDFNGWLERALIALIDEVQPVRDGRGGYVNSDLKNYITEPRITIRNMYSAGYEAPSFVNFILSSNQGEPWTIDSDDRRFNVGDYGGTKLQITTKEVLEDLPKELDNFLDFMMSYPVNLDQARSVLANKARETVIQIGRMSADVVAESLKLGDLEALWDLRPDVETMDGLGGFSTQAMLSKSYTDFLRRVLTEGSKRTAEAPWRTAVTRDELQILFDYTVGQIPKTPAKFGQYLRHRGIELVRVRRGEQLHYGVYIEWKAGIQWVRERLEESGQRAAPQRKLAAVPHP